MNFLLTREARDVGNLVYHQLLEDVNTAIILRYLSIGSWVHLFPEHQRREIKCNDIWKTSEVPPTLIS